MAEEKKGKGEKDEKKHQKHAKGEGPIVPKQEGEKKPKKGGKEKKAPATIQAAQGKAKAKGDHPARLAEAYKANVIPQLMKDFGYKNPMQVPKIEKIVVNMGLGEAISNNKLVEQAQEQMMAISGQKPVITKARKSIANFKLRAGQRRPICRRNPAFLHKFQMCRICFRNRALKGEITGVIKSSW